MHYNKTHITSCDKGAASNVILNRNTIKVAFGQPGDAEHFCQSVQAEAGDGLPAIGNFHFRFIEVTHNSNPRSGVMMHLMAVTKPDVEITVER